MSFPDSDDTCAVLLNGKTVLGAFPFTQGDTVGTVDARLTSLLSLPSSHKILLRGKHLSDPSTPFSPSPNSSIYILSTTASAIATLNAHGPDPLLRGFSSAPSRFSARPTSSSPSALSPYGFGSIAPLRGLPNEAKAQELLTTLANDPGFLAVMHARRWRVGVLAEMEAEGKVGVDPVCVLGYNTNAGASIHLRLRTDDGAGFRPMFKLREVLAHELAHNVYSEHDARFYELMSAVKKEADRADWRRGTGRATGFEGSVEGRDPLDEGNGRTLNIVERLGSGPARSLDGGRGEKDLVRETGVGVEAGIGAITEHVPSDSALLPQETSRPSLVTSSSDEGASVRLDTSSSSAPGDILPAPKAAISSDLSAAAPTQPAKDENMDVNAPPALVPTDDVDTLVMLGFAPSLAKVALRESKGQSNAAADWLLNLSVDEPSSSESADASDGAAMAKRLNSAISGLGKDRDEVLVTIHLYLFNLLSRPDDTRLRSINSANAAFRHRVGRHAASAEMLRAIGFTLQDSGKWHLTIEDDARIWLAKDVLIQALARPLEA